jgi:large subunit ribosomal protein L6
MTVEKISLDNGVFVNNTVRFVIVVTNTGDCNLTDVKVTEDFDPAELKYENIVDSTGKWSKSSDYVFVYDGNLTVGESANFTIVFTALVNGTLENQVNASSNQTDNKTGNNTTTVYKPNMTVEKVTLDNGVITVTRPNDLKENRALHGLTRTLIANMVQGVNEGFKKELEINGIGYRAAKQGKDLVLNIGYSHDVIMPEIDGITVEVPAPNKIIISGPDKQKVGQFEAEVRGKRPPEPYKGKGIKYIDEVIRRKEGKAGKGK